MSITLSVLNGFSKFFRWHTLWKICDKIITKDPTTPNTRRHTTLWNMHFQKLHKPKHLQQQTKRAWTKENVIMVDELVLSQ